MIERLSFAQLNRLQDNLVEVIVDFGIEIDETMVEEYHHWLTTNLSAPFAVMINRINEYSYSFKAQLQIGNVEQMHAIAVVTQSKTAKVSTRIIADTVPRANPWNYQLFEERQDALNWLQQQLATLD